MLICSGVLLELEEGEEKVMEGLWALELMLKTEPPDRPVTVIPGPPPIGICSVSPLHTSLSEQTRADEGGPPLRPVEGLWPRGGPAGGRRGKGLGAGRRGRRGLPVDAGAGADGEGAGGRRAGGGGGAGPGRPGLVAVRRRRGRVEAGVGCRHRLA